MEFPMRSAIIDANAHAPLRVVEHPDPRPRPGWVVVQIDHAGVTRHDVAMLGRYAWRVHPATPGSDGAGRIVAIGARVKRFGVGDPVVMSPWLGWRVGTRLPGPRVRVLGTHLPGTHAELVAVPAGNVFHLPSRLTAREAAALPMTGLTAWRALTTVGRLRQGETVVVSSASSAQGLVAIQIAAALGARVIALASDTRRQLALDCGATETVDSSDRFLAAHVREIVGGRGASLVLDTDGRHWAALLSGLRPGGRLVTVATRPTGLTSVDARLLAWRHLQILGSEGGSRQEFAGFLDHVDSTHWTPVVDAVLPLSEIARAYALLGHPTSTGGVVLDVSRKDGTGPARTVRTSDGEQPEDAPAGGPPQGAAHPIPS
jgi:NADPH:quinone reductase-like Zn-dependent oxidoreductase